MSAAHAFKSIRPTWKSSKAVFSSEKTAFIKTMRGLANARQEKYSENQVISGGQAMWPRQKFQMSFTQSLKYTKGFYR